MEQADLLTISDNAREQLHELREQGHPDSLILILLLNYLSDTQQNVEEMLTVLANA